MAGAADHALLDALGRRLRQPAGWLAVVLHLSRLTPPAPRPHHRRIARVLMDDTARRHDGAVFALSNGDLALVCRTGDDRAPAPTLRVASPSSLPTVLARLLRADAPDPRAVVDFWPLESAGNAALAYAQARVARDAAPAPVAKPVPPAAASREDGSEAANHLARRTTILMTASGVRALYREIGFPRAAGADTDPYVTRHVAERLDARLLGLVHGSLGDGGPLDPTVPTAPRLHLGLTLAGLRSDAFAALLQALLARGLALGIEIALTEACADPDGFERARRELRRQGVAIVLDGLSRQTLGLARVSALQPDLVKLAWSPRMGEQEPSVEAEDALIRRLGAERVVLHGTDDEAALRWGFERGIRRFQGRYTEAMLGALRFSICPSAPGCTLRQCIAREAAGSLAVRQGCGNLALLDAAAPPILAPARPPPPPLPPADDPPMMGPLARAALPAPAPAMGA